MERIGENWRESERVRENRSGFNFDRRESEKIGKDRIDWIAFEKIRENQRELERIREKLRGLEKIGEDQRRFDRIR